MMIETTVMRFGHGLHGMIGIILKEKSLEFCALSFHATTKLEQVFLNLKKDSSLPSTSHEKEGKGRITSNCQDRKSIQKALQMGIHPFSDLKCSDDIDNICTCQVSSDKVNVDQCASIGKDQVKSFYESLPDGFYKPFSKKFVTIAAGKSSAKVGDVDGLDTTLIYSRVVALQMTNTIIEVKLLFSYELAPLQTSMFDKFGEIRVDKSKAKLRKLLAKEASARNISKPDLVVLDGFAILWSVNWPSNGKVPDFADNFLSYVFILLHEFDVYLVFNRYY